MKDYLVKFKDDGTRGMTYAAGVHYHLEEVTKEDSDEAQEIKAVGDTIDVDQALADGFVWIAEDEMQYYIGNKGDGDNGTGYIRQDGKPVSAPPYEPTQDELMTQLDTQYNSDKQELASMYLEAVMSGDNDTAAAIKTELAALNEKYDTDYQSIVSKYSESETTADSDANKETEAK